MSFRPKVWIFWMWFRFNFLKILLDELLITLHPIFYLILGVVKVFGIKWNCYLVFENTNLVPGTEKVTNIYFAFVNRFHFRFSASAPLIHVCLIDAACPSSFLCEAVFNLFLISKMSDNEKSSLAEAVIEAEVTIFSIIFPLSIKE